MAFWKIRARDRLVLDDEAISQIAYRAESRMAEMSDRTRALRTCLGELTPRQRELLENRYSSSGSLKQLAERLGRPESSLSQTLYRIRMALLDCVKLRLVNEKT
jgi:RNA polymerase sigma factor (sigma-70 family)